MLIHWLEDRSLPSVTDEEQLMTNQFEGMTDPRKDKKATRHQRQRGRKTVLHQHQKNYDYDFFGQKHSTGCCCKTET